MQKNIILTGSISFDYIFDVNDSFSKYILPDKIHKINFSFVIDTHQKSWGGTAGNQAFYLAQLGFEPFLLACGGYDFSDYRAFLNKIGVRTDLIKIDNNLPTGTGFVITDQHDNQIWMYSKGAMQKNANLSVKKIAKKINDLFVVISPNDPNAIIKLVGECSREKIDFAFDPAFYIPTLPLDTLKDGVRNAQFIFGNDYEIAFLEKRFKKKLETLITHNQIIIKTLGDKGSEIFHDGKWIKIGIYKTKTVDPTGAGDAYRAGFLYGYFNNKSMKECGQMGAVVASFAVEIKGTMNLKFSKKGFEQRLQNFTKYKK